jgi:hypothetical protein
MKGRRKVGKYLTQFLTRRLVVWEVITGVSEGPSTSTIRSENGKQEVRLKPRYSHTTLHGVMLQKTVTYCNPFEMLNYDVVRCRSRCDRPSHNVARENSVKRVQVRSNTFTLLGTKNGLECLRYRKLLWRGWNHPRGTFIPERVFYAVSTLLRGNCSVLLCCSWS